LLSPASRQKKADRRQAVASHDNLIRHNSHNFWEGGKSAIGNMATDSIVSDPLLSLRRAIAAQALPSPTTSSDVSTANEGITDDLAEASHLFFSHPAPPHTIPLNTSTRFVSAASNDTPVDLRSIFFAWQKKDVAIPEYIASAQEVNEALKKKVGGEQILNLVFVERLDLITWLEGASDDSEYIKPLEGAAAAAAAAAAVAAPTAAALEESAVPAATVPAAAGPGAARPAKVIDPRLQEIYNGERKLGDRNTVLRGIKPTVRLAFYLPLFNKKHCLKLTMFRRNSPTSAKQPKPSSAGIATLALARTNQYLAKAESCQRLQPDSRYPESLRLLFHLPRHRHPLLHAASTLSFFCLLLPRRPSGFPISNHSCKTASLCRLTIPLLHRPQHPTCKSSPGTCASTASLPAAVGLENPASPALALLPVEAGGQPGSSSPTAPPTSNQITGNASLPSSPRAKPGNSNRTNGPTRPNSFGTRPAFTST
jgi:hypothetical protein